MSSAKVSHPGDGKNPDYSLVAGADPRKDPVRLLVVQGDARPAVDVSDEPMVMTVPHLVLRELIALLAISLVLVVISLFVDAPLEELANPERTPNPAKAPWYFLGVQELAHYSAFWGGVFVPAALVLGLCALPYFDRGTAGLGRYFPRERWLACTLFSATMVFLAVVTLIGTLFRGPGWAFGWYWP